MKQLVKFPIVTGFVRGDLTFIQRFDGLRQRVAEEESSARELWREANGPSHWESEFDESFERDLGILHAGKDVIKLTTTGITLGMIAT